MTVKLNIVNFDKVLTVRETQYGSKAAPSSATIHHDDLD